jgi:hypothetical protein
MEQENTTQATPTELTLTDLVNIKSIIEAAVKRGAFSANEVSSVGSAYDKLANFLASAVPAKTEEQTSKTE